MENRSKKSLEYGLIGRHLSHSFSKPIHESLAGYTFELCELEPEEIESFMKEKPFKGINITIPYKQTVLEYVDEADAAVKSVGCTNCIVNENGKLIAHNTDYDGIGYTFRLKNVDVKGKKALILGKGGAAKAYHAWLQDHGACEILHVYYKEDPDCITYEQAYTQHQDADIIINATPVGMAGHSDESPVDLSGFDDLEFVFDAIYNPLKTPLLIQADELGIPNANGLFMLVEQARTAAGHFSKKDIPVEKTLEIWQQIISDKLNIVLIGMPSSGKSTIAKRLSSKLNKPVVEIDELIVQDIKMPISDYFAKYGEPAFRKKEKEITLQAASRNGQIISTGGGVILDPENIKALQKNSLIIWLQRPLDMLISKDESRPTLAQGLENLYEKRKGLYEKACDLRIENVDPPYVVAERIARGLEKIESLDRFM